METQGPTGATALIVSYNVRAHLRRCLASLARYAADTPVVVADNASRDGSADMVAREFPDVTLLAEGENAGFGRAANDAARLARTPYLFFLNPDAEVRAETVATLAAFLQNRPPAAAVGPRVETPAGALESTMRDAPTAGNLLREHLPLVKRRTARFDGHARARRAAWLVGAALMVRRDVFEKINGFDESFPLYYEDADLCLRLGEAGCEVWLEPAARVTHVGAASALAAFGSHREIKLKYIRARSHLIRKHYGPGALFLYRVNFSALTGGRWLGAALAGRRADREFHTRALAAIWAE